MKSAILNCFQIKNSEPEGRITLFNKPGIHQKGQGRMIHKRFALFLAAVLMLSILPLTAHADYDYIDITNPFIRKIPLAAQEFKAVDATEEELKFSRESVELINNTLDFTGYFKMLDSKSFLVDPQKAGIIRTDIEFKNWTTIGAELLITGAIVVKDDIVEMELRLFDTFKTNLLTGKRYKGWVTDQRRMVLRFCSEVIYTLTGNAGYFDSKIAFVSNGTGNKEIYTCDFDGGNPVQITNHKSITLSPSWSDDGSWMAYTSYKDGKPDIFIRHLTEKRGYIVNKKGTNITPAFRPGAFELAASLTYQGDPDIFLLNGNGDVIKKLTDSWGIDVSPVWAPDGKRIAFVSNRAGNPQIYTMDLETGNVERLTFNGKYNTSPSWSPKGDLIAYTALDKNQFDIWIIGQDGSNPVKLTDGPGDSESPTFSPDGTMIAFTSNRDGKYRLYVMTRYGTEQRKLLTFPGEQYNPRWSRNFLAE